MHVYQLIYVQEIENSRIESSDRIHCVVSVWSRCFVMFSLLNSGYQLVRTVATVSAQWPVEHFKNALQNIPTDQMPHCLEIAPF